MGSGWGLDAPLESTLTDLRVIAVDDDADSVDLTAALLRLCGASVRTARSAAEALAVIQTWVPDVLLSDLEMPGEDGYQLLARVRGLPGRLGSIPAIAITAHHQAHDQARAIANGFTVLIPKPLDLLALVAALVDFRPPAAPSN